MAVPTRNKGIREHGEEGAAGETVELYSRTNAFQVLAWLKVLLKDTVAEFSSH